QRVLDDTHAVWKGRDNHASTPIAHDYESSRRGQPPPPAAVPRQQPLAETTRHGLPRSGKARPSPPTPKPTATPWPSIGSTARRPTGPVRATQGTPKGSNVEIDRRGSGVAGHLTVFPNEKGCIESHGNAIPRAWQTSQLAVGVAVPALDEKRKPVISNDGAAVTRAK